MRPINLRPERFNQNATSGSLIVEVGTSSNTLREALTPPGFSLPRPATSSISIDDASVNSCGFDNGTCILTEKKIK